jgi:hypothetical protein
VALLNEAADLLDPAKSPDFGGDGAGRFCHGPQAQHPVGWDVRHGGNSAPLRGCAIIFAIPCHQWCRPCQFPMAQPRRAPKRAKAVKAVKTTPVRAVPGCSQGYPYSVSAADQNAPVGTSPVGGSVVAAIIARGIGTAIGINPVRPVPPSAIPVAIPGVTGASVAIG